jgi:hypothetical protein
MSISPATKQKWFEQGAVAFGEAAPTHRGRGYACPICLGISPDINTFTVEDVPPQSVGGRPLILTCERCNSTSGSQLDWHWANFLRVENFIAGGPMEAVTTKFVYDGRIVAAEVSNDGLGYTIKLIKKASNPDNLRDVEAIVRERIESGTPPEKFNLTFSKNRFDPRLMNLSVLRAAYLTGVAVMGYRWIRQWDDIRRQILDPQAKMESLSALVRHEPKEPHSRRLLGVIEEPLDMRSLCLEFGPFRAFLPFDLDSVLYRPGDLAAKQWEFKGHSYEWPKHPSFGMPSDET